MNVPTVATFVEKPSVVKTISEITGESYISISLSLGSHVPLTSALKKMIEKKERNRAFEK